MVNKILIDTDVWLPALNPRLGIDPGPCIPLHWLGSRPTGIANMAILANNSL